MLDYLSYLLSDATVGTLRLEGTLAKRFTAFYAIR